MRSRTGADVLQRYYATNELTSRRWHSYETETRELSFDTSTSVFLGSSFGAVGCAVATGKTEAVLPCDSDGAVQECGGGPREPSCASAYLQSQNCLSIHLLRVDTFVDVQGQKIRRIIQQNDRKKKENLRKNSKEGTVPHRLEKKKRFATTLE